MHRHNVILKARLAGVARVSSPPVSVEVSDAKDLSLDRLAPAAPVAPTSLTPALPPALDAAALSSLVAELADLAHKAKMRESRALGDLAQASVELAAAIAERLIGTAIAADRQRLDRIVLDALERMQPARAVGVRGHPSDLALLERLLSEHTDLGRYREILTFREDEACVRGQLRVEADDWFIDWDTPRSLAEIRAALLDETFTDE